MIAPADLEEVRALKARYFRYVDTKDWDALASLYSPDASFEGFAFDTASPAAFVTNVAAYLDGVESVHHGFTPEFRSLGDGRIRALWPMEDYLRWEPGSRDYRGVDVEGLCGIRGYGHYHDEYARLDGTWVISYQKLTRLRVDPVLLPMAAAVVRFPFETLTKGWME